MKFVSILLCVAACYTQAATYHVTPTGLSTNPGTEAQPWSLSKAISSVAPGDTVLMNGTWSGSAAVFVPTVDGTQGARILWQKKPGGTWVMKDGPNIFPIGIVARNTPWQIIDGLHMTNMARHITGYNTLGTTGAPDTGGMANWEIRNCHFAGPYPGFGFYAIMNYDTGTNNWYHHNIFGNTNSGYGVINSSGDDLGSWVALGNYGIDSDSGWNIFEYNIVMNGGHDLIHVGSSHNVIRFNNFFNPAWMPNGKPDRTDPFDGPPFCGNRLIEVAGKHATNNLITDNYFWNSSVAEDDRGAFGIEMQAKFTMLRRNFFNNLGLAGIGAQNKPQTTTNFNNYYYQNTINVTAYDPWINFYTMSAPIALGPSIAGTRIVNNILRLDKNNRNILYNGNEAVTEVRGNTTVNFDPKFANTNFHAHRWSNSLPDLTLQDTSPCIDAGVWLTTVTSASGSGTTMQVADSGYFYWGYNNQMGAVIPGDLIQLQGSAQTARVVANNKSNNTLTLSSPLTWTTGQGVALAYAGNAPDQGAWESGITGGPPEGEPPMVVQNPTSRTVQEGAATTFSVTVAGTAPFLYQWKKDTVSITDATNSSLILNPVALADAGSYTCAITNDFGDTLTSAATLTVNPITALANPGFEQGFTSWTTNGGNLQIFNGPPWVPTEGTNIVGMNVFETVPNGSISQTFLTTNGVNYCVLFDFGAHSQFVTTPQTVQFTIEGANIILNQFYSTNSGGTAGDLVRWRTVTNDFFANSGTTKFTITDASADGSNVSLVLDNFRLIVIDTPVIVTHPLNQTVNAGQTATFTVVATGSGLTYQWRKGGVDIGGETASSLAITDAQEEDEGLYDVVVSNINGTATSLQASLTVESPGDYPFPGQPGAVIRIIGIIE